MHINYVSDLCGADTCIIDVVKKLVHHFNDLPVYRFRVVVWLL